MAYTTPKVKTVNPPPDKARPVFFTPVERKLLGLKKRIEQLPDESLERSRLLSDYKRDVANLQRQNDWTQPRSELAKQCEANYWQSMLGRDVIVNA